MNSASRGPPFNPQVVGSSPTPVIFHNRREYALVRGVIPDQLVTVIDATLVGDAVDLTYRDAAGRTASQLMLRNREPDLELGSS